jgi:hypothetical protein
LNDTATSRYEFVVADRVTEAVDDCRRRQHPPGEESAGAGRRTLRQK